MPLPGLSQFPSVPPQNRLSEATPPQLNTFSGAAPLMSGILSGATPPQINSTSSGAVPLISSTLPGVTPPQTNSTLMGTTPLIANTFPIATPLMSSSLPRATPLQENSVVPSEVTSSDDVSLDINIIVMVTMLSGDKRTQQNSSKVKENVTSGIWLILLMSDQYVFS